MKNSLKSAITVYEGMINMPLGKRFTLEKDVNYQNDNRVPNIPEKQKQSKTAQYNYV